MQGNLGSQPHLERGALDSVVIAGGVKMKLLAVWFCGNRSMAKEASEDRLAYMLICWRRTPGSPETACRQRWMTGLDGERQPCGSTEVDLVVLVVVSSSRRRRRRSSSGGGGRRRRSSSSMSLV